MYLIPHANKKKTKSKLSVIERVNKTTVTCGPLLGTILQILIFEGSCVLLLHKELYIVKCHIVDMIKRIWQYKRKFKNVTDGLASASINISEVFERKHSALHQPFVSLNLTSL